MTWATVYLIAICVVIFDGIFVALAHRYEQFVHSREAAFRPRDNQSNNVSKRPHGERFK